MGGCAILLISTLLKIAMAAAGAAIFSILFVATIPPALFGAFCMGNYCSNDFLEKDERKKYAKIFI